MTITLTPEIEKRISERVSRGDYASPEWVVEQAVRHFLEFDDAEPELEQVFPAIVEAQSQGDAGQGIALEDFERAMRAKHGISH